MFICPKCNVEVVNPTFLPPPPWWRRPRGSSNRPYPVCPNGHRLRSRLMGNMTELALPWAILRGLAISATSLVMGMLQDMRTHLSPRNHLGLTMMTAVGLILGCITFGYAWSWAGRSGPVHRLTSRACGEAVGFLVPALIMLHALYFHWAGMLQRAFVTELVRVAGIVLHWSADTGN